MADFQICISVPLILGFLISKFVEFEQWNEIPQLG